MCPVGYYDGVKISIDDAHSRSAPDPLSFSLKSLLFYLLLLSVLFTLLKSAGIVLCPDPTNISGLNCFRTSFFFIAILLLFYCMHVVFRNRFRTILENVHESEENFRMIADLSPNMIFINQRGKVIYVNQKCVGSWVTVTMSFSPLTSIL